MAPRSRTRVLRRAAVLLMTVPGLLLASAVAAAAAGPDGPGQIGDIRDPDPLSALQAWGIYGGVVVGGFLIALVLMARSGRRETGSRYRPGRTWEHGPEWFGAQPEVDDARPRAAVPGAGGASGRW